MTDTAMMAETRPWAALQLSRSQPSPWFVARLIGNRLIGHYEQLRDGDGGLARFDTREAAEAAIRRIKP